MNEMVAGRSARRRLFSAALAAMVGIAAKVGAQPEQPPDGVTIGEFWFRPSFELRVRGDYAHQAPDGAAIEQAVLSTVPPHVTGPEHTWGVHERARLGLSVERGLLSAAIVVQDARLAGFPSPTGTDRTDPAPATGIHTAFLEVRGPDRAGSYIRLGRQEVVWGDGRLLGVSDWSPVPRALDAARAHLATRNLDVEALAVLLSPPGSVPPPLAGQVAVTGTGAGAQLYGLSFSLHVDPLFHGQLFGLGRVARQPLPATLTSSDLFAAGARLYGDRAGLGYAAEFVYEVGRVGGLPTSYRSMAAWGAAARAYWQPTALLRLKLELQGSYATGGDREHTAHRFDPILPDDRAGLGQMGVYAWTNIADAALVASFEPVEDVLTVRAGYRYLRLADSAGAWFSAELLPIGQNVFNDSAFLGHELDAAIEYAPLPALALRAGGSFFVTGAGAQALLNSADPSSAPRILSSAFLQARVTAP